MSDDWHHLDTVAEQLEEDPAGLKYIAKGYSAGYRAKLPVLRRVNPNAEPGTGVYVYRVDRDPPWPGERVYRIYERRDQTWGELAASLPCTKTTLCQIGSRGVWAGAKLWQPLDRLVDADADRDMPPADRWWAVCDEVCGRLIVEQVKATREQAEGVIGGATYAPETCPPALVKGQGERPETGMRLELGEEMERVSIS